MKLLSAFLGGGKLSFPILLIVAFLLVSAQTLNAQPIILENDQLRVELLQQIPAAEKYTLKSNNEVIYGHISYYSYWAQIFHGGSLH